jgi:two-component system chemotaxis sensor kinase CheA
MDLDHEAILQTFLAETEENLAAVEEALVELEGRPDDEEALGVIFRAAHTLKGDAASFGFAGVGSLAHSIEDVLDKLRLRAMPVTSDLVTTLLRCVDALRKMVPAAARGEAHAGADPEALIAALSALVEDAERGVAWPEGARGDQGGAQSPVSKSHARTLRIETEKLDRMLNLITEIAVSRGRLAQVIESSGGSDAARVLEAHRSADGLHRDLQELIMRARMVPIEATFRSYIRVVRDLAHQSGKLARITIDAQGVEIDTRIAEHIRDPLTHMIRNAIDHGIEPPEEREAAGKDPIGTVSLSARHEAGSIVVRVADDGAGLNRAKIAACAAALELAPDPDALPDHELFRFIFEPGFSTAAEVSSLSGRGIGMDVVRRNVEDVRGSLRVDSTAGQGTSITIRLPLTLAIIDGFAVGVADETYVIPMEAVRECVELPVSERGKTEGRGVINLRGHALPYVHLRSVLELDASRSSPHADERQSVVVVHYDGGRAGLVVDALFGESQTVIKPLGKMFHGVLGVSGSAILSDGRVALILDVPALFRKVLPHSGDVGAEPVGPSEAAWGERA